MNSRKPWLLDFSLALLGLALAVSISCGGGDPVRPPPPLHFALNEARAFPSATRLKDGRILVAGGSRTAPGGSTLSIASAELVDPVTGDTRLTGSMAQPRKWHTSTLLQDGKVLVTGGSPGVGHPIALDGAELYDPATGRFQPTGSMNFARHDHTATLMKDGRVLITGGDGPNPDQIQGGTEIYNPATGRFDVGNPMVNGRTEHASVLLPSGEVWVAGGLAWWGSGAVYWLESEAYDPVAQRFRPLPALLPKPMWMTSFLSLPSGGLLLADAGGAIAFDPATGSLGPHSPALKTRGYAPWLPWSGGALVVGGINLSANPVAWHSDGEFYVEAENRFKPAAFTLAHPRMGHAAVNLDGVTVLVIGGLGSDGMEIAGMELIRP